LSATERTPLSLHDALPISLQLDDRRQVGDVDDVDRRAAESTDRRGNAGVEREAEHVGVRPERVRVVQPDQVDEADVLAVSARSQDRKSTRLNSSHRTISYA